MFEKLSFIVAISFLLNGCAITDESKLIDIEDSNAYLWQKYMNEDEFQQLKKGMTYLDVVQVAKGRGAIQKKDIYIWEDERKLTQAYKIHFINNRLVQKEVIELHGHSKR